MSGSRQQPVDLELGKDRLDLVAREDDRQTP
jgi:hypothetical protein